MTRVDTDTSSPLVKGRRFPQGSCLGPRLYTSDLDRYVRHCTGNSYADDCQAHMPFDFNELEGGD